MQIGHLRTTCVVLKLDAIAVACVLLYVSYDKMAGVVAVIAKIMPDGPDEDLEKIKAEAKAKLEEGGAQNISFEIKDVAFGLKAVMVKFAWPEEKDTSIFEDKLAGIEGVSSATTEDYRRAFG